MQTFISSLVMSKIPIWLFTPKEVCRPHPRVKKGDCLQNPPRNTFIEGSHEGPHGLCCQRRSPFIGLGNVIQVD